MRVLQRGLIGGTLVVVAASTGATAYAMQSGAHSAVTAQSAKKTIKIIDDSKATFLFSPKTATVKVGTKVTWTNTSSAAHTVTSNKQGLFNKNIGTGQSISVTFKKAGTYSYFCAIHPFMKGKIIVK